MVAEMTNNNMKSRPGEQPLKRVLNLLRAIQFDRWVLVGGTPQISVMSHGDIDHNPQLASMPHAKPIAVTVRFRFSVTGDVGTDRFICEYDVLNLLKGFSLYPLKRVRERFTEYRDFHADWWFITDRKASVLFIGELDYPEVELVKSLIKYISDVGRKPDVVLLPSYGGVITHKVPERSPQALQSSIRKLALQLKSEKFLLGALPHPIGADWSDFEFVYLV